MNQFSTLSFISQGDVVVSLKTKETGIEGISEVQISLYGESKSLLDISFEYKLYESEYWKTDAVLVSGRGIDGNILKGLDCSASGKTHLVYWNYKANKLSNGQECLLIARVLPSENIFLTSEAGTWSERVSTHESESFISGTVINKDKSGNLLRATSNSIEIVNLNGTPIVSIGGFNMPSFALQKGDGNYLILDSGNNRLVEVGANYTDLIRILDLSTYVDNPPHMAFDELTKNILVSGGLTQKIYEFTYGDEDYGTLLWEHGDGTTGDGIDQLRNPYGVSYAEDRSVVYIADYGNNRIVKCDRKSSPEIIDSFKVGSAEVPIYRPKFIQATGSDSFLLIEGQGERELYSRDSNSHISLKRFNSSNPTRSGDKDNLPEYNNLMFSPVSNVIFRNGGWESSSSSSLNSKSSESSESESSDSSSSSKSTSSSVSTSDSGSSLTSVSLSSESSSIEQAKIYISAISFSTSPEWVEITNTGPYPRNMSKWHIISHEQPPPCPVASPLQKYTFPTNFVLPAGGSVKIYSGTGSGSWNNNPPTSLWWGVGSKWHDDGDIADLRNHQGKLISTKSWGNCP